MKKWIAVILTVCLLAMGLPAMAWETTSWIGDGMYLAETPLYGSSANKIRNIELAAEALNGTAIYYGETFSFNETVGPRTKELGYTSARNGRGADVLGGGVSQLATTLYLAVRDAGYVSFEPFKTYDEKFADWYVEDGYDAVITDYNAGHDFQFTSEYDGVIYIDAWMDEYYVYCMVTFDESRSSTMLLSRASTPVFGSANKLHNIDLAAESLNGVILGFGESFSFNDLVGARTKEAGFRNAENGRGVKVYGGGVAQVASTIYLAVKELDCISVDPIRTYGSNFVDGYVVDSSDAVVTDYNAGVDFSFTYWGYGTALILVYQDADRLVCEIFEF